MERKGLSLPLSSQKVQQGQWGAGWRGGSASRMETVPLAQQAQQEHQAIAGIFSELTSNTWNRRNNKEISYGDVVRIVETD